MLYNRHCQKESVERQRKREVLKFSSGKGAEIQLIQSIKVNKTVYENLLISLSAVL